MRRSPSAYVLDILCNNDAAPFDFLCPSLSHPRRAPKPSQHAPRGLPDDPPPASSTFDYPPRRRRSDPRRKSHRSEPLTVSKFPIKFAPAGDGSFTPQPQWSLHGRGLTCSGQTTVAMGSAKPTADYQADLGAGTGSSPSVDASPDSDDFMSSLPSGWGNEKRETPYTLGLTVGLSVALALTIAIIIIGLVTWRRPFTRRKRARPLRDDLIEKNLRMMLDGDDDPETGVPGLDEDPQLKGAAKRKRQAWKNAVTRWKSKARGKATPSLRTAISASTVSGRAPSVRSSRRSIDDEGDSSDTDRATIVTVLADELADSAPPASPRPGPGDLPRATQTPTTPPVPAEEPDDVAGPPAYRRSYMGRTGGGRGSEAEVARSDELEPGPSPSPNMNPNSTVTLSRIWHGAAAARAAVGDRKAPVHVEEEEEEDHPDATLPPPPLSEDEQRRGAHVATDDKGVLARMAMMASAPGGSASSAPEEEVVVQVPEWRDEEWEDFEQEHEAPQEAPVAGALPCPPRRVVQASLVGAYDLGPTEPGPSAPPGAPPLEEEVQASAPPPPEEEEELDVPGYEP